MVYCNPGLHLAPPPISYFVIQGCDLAHPNGWAKWFLVISSSRSIFIDYLVSRKSDLSRNFGHLYLFRLILNKSKIHSVTWTIGSRRRYFWRGWFFYAVIQKTHSRSRGRFFHIFHQNDFILTPILTPRQKCLTIIFDYQAFNHLVCCPARIRT